MKKIFICLIMLFILSGCASNSVDSEVTDDDSMFVRIENTNMAFDVVYHKKTKVMYAISTGGYNGGTVTVLVDENGSPMLYGKE